MGDTKYWRFIALGDTIPHFSGGLFIPSSNIWKKSNEETYEYYMLGEKHKCKQTIHE